MDVSKSLDLIPADIRSILWTALTVALATGLTVVIEQLTKLGGEYNNIIIPILTVALHAIRKYTTTTYYTK